MKLPLGKALLTLFWATCMISGSAGAGLLYYKNYQSRKAQNDKYRLVAIVQTCPEKEPLKTPYFAELLNLSIDQPVNLYAFNTRAATQRLLASPLIKDVAVAKIYPGTLYIDYHVRTPVAFLADYTNTALDAEGIPIPFKPFFTPKKLPNVHLGLECEKFLWGKPIGDPRISLAMGLLNYVSEHLVDARCRVRRIDVSHAYAPSYGERELIVALEELVEKDNALVVVQRILRLNRDSYKQELARFKALDPQLSEESVLIDLRLPQLAFIKTEPMDKL